jgi:serine phosphatase RsbU (regulator of sigma subunit)
VETHATTTRLPNDFVLGIWLDDHEAWFATSDGLGHGIFAASGKSLTAAAKNNLTDKDKP